MHLRMQGASTGVRHRRITSTKIWSLDYQLLRHSLGFRHVSTLHCISCRSEMVSLHSVLTVSNGWSIVSSSRRLWGPCTISVRHVEFLPYFPASGQVMTCEAERDKIVGPSSSISAPPTDYLAGLLLTCSHSPLPKASLLLTGALSPPPSFVYFILCLRVLFPPDTP